MNNTEKIFRIREFTPKDSGVWWVFWILGPIGIAISLVLKFMMDKKYFKNLAQNIPQKIIHLTFSQIKFSGEFFKDKQPITVGIPEIKKIEYSSNRPGVLEIFTHSYLPFFINGNPNDLKPFLETLKSRGIEVNKIMPLSAKIFYGILILLVLFLIYGFFKAKAMIADNETLSLLLNL